MEKTWLKHCLTRWLPDLPIFLKIYHFSQLNTIPLYICLTFPLFTSLLMTIEADVISWLLWLLLQSMNTEASQWCVSIRPSGVHPEVPQLDHSFIFSSFRGVGCCLFVCLFIFISFLMVVTFLSYFCVWLKYYLWVISFMSSYPLLGNKSLYSQD